MSSRFYPLLIVAIAAVLIGNSSELRADDCPCGPDGLGPMLQRLVPQEIGGA